MKLFDSKKRLQISLTADKVLLHFVYLMFFTKANNHLSCF